MPPANGSACDVDHTVLAGSMPRNAALTVPMIIQEPVAIFEELTRDLG